MGKGPPPPPPVRKTESKLGPPAPPPREPASIGLVGEAMELVERIEASPRARAAVHELRFFSASIRRTGEALAGQMREILTDKLHNDPKVRPWLVNALGYARELLERAG